jgi:two-component system cell cycle sensor histidine kinase/response regulator CckA
MEQISILLLEDNPWDADLVQRTLRSDGLQFALKRVDNEKDFRLALQGSNPDLIISDFSLPAYSGKHALAASRELAPSTPFIFYSGTLGEEAAIEALKLGATDYVLKERPRRLFPAIVRALEEARQNASRKAAEKRIVSLARILDLATDAIMVRTIDGRILSWNNAAERLYGFTRTEVESTDLTDLIYRSPACDHQQAKISVLRDGRWEGELEQLTKDKRSIVVLSRWTLALDRDGRPEQILIINTDITEKKQLEKQFLRAQRLESIGTLASGIAHDLNNILAPIMMCSELLKAQESKPDSVAMLETIQKSAERGAEIVKQVLTFVRGTEGKRAPVNLGHLISEIYKVIAAAFPKNIEIKCDIEPTLSKVRGDFTQLHQVLINLCINARDAMPDGGKLTLSGRNLLLEPSSTPGVLLEVQDSGTGIPPELLEKIFDPFFTTKEPGKGTGLGLSTVLGIVKSHSGTINVQSNPGSGTIFRIVLPAIETGHQEQLATGASRSLLGNGELILVVDDEPEIRKALAQTLMHYGYEVLTAEDGAAAILRLKESRNSVKLLLMDKMMPGLDGASLAKTVKNLQPEIKIIATGGAAEEVLIPQATSFLQKLFSTENLLRTINQALAGPSQS